MTKEDKQQSDIDIIIVIDKDKLPEALRDKFPQDLQDKLIELLQEGTCCEQQSKPFKQSDLFSVQQGTIIGNIYKDKLLQDQLVEQK